MHTPQLWLCRMPTVARAVWFSGHLTCRPPPSPPGQAVAGGQPPVSPPVVPEQQAKPEVEQQAGQQMSSTGNTWVGRRRTTVTEDRTALLERFLCLRPPMFSGEYDPDKAESWTHELKRTFETMECAEEDQRFLEIFHGEYFPDYARRERQDMFHELVQSSPYQHPSGSRSSTTSSSSGETSQQRQGVRQAEETGW
ncbi:hypothetical protein Taro_027072 [Colocasia esculenta]|uniref:Retrotransposon gag domain-containing protein n=1 Tax=Colocasia esculenta TaxID=4460 RepID=A0A843VDK1_COLES|nr:hypothetical protein [Colocasia esculenta]